MKQNIKHNDINKKYSDIFHIELHTPWLPAPEDSVYAMILPIAAVALPSLYIML